VRAHPKKKQPLSNLSVITRVELGCIVESVAIIPETRIDSVYFFFFAVFLAGFAASFVAVLTEVDLLLRPPKIDSQFVAYFSLVPTRVIVTKSPFFKY
jgi:hypothetical protein